MNNFSERIKELRTDKGLTQRELAQELGFSQPAIACWEANIQIPNIDVLVKYALYFKVSTDYILGLED